jgi:hypothetical protein
MMLLGNTLTQLIMVLGVMIGIAKTVPSECKSEHVSIPFLKKSGEGWDVSFAKQAKLISSRPYLGVDGQDSGLRYVEYEAKEQVITLPEIEVDTCNHTGTIQEFYLIPKQVAGFENAGRTFAYAVLVQMIAGPNLDSQALGSQMNVIFYDMHGNGKFDSVRIGAGVGMPLIPDWVKASGSMHDAASTAKKQRVK